MPLISKQERVSAAGELRKALDRLIQLVDAPEDTPQWRRAVAVWGAQVMKHLDLVASPTTTDEAVDNAVRFLDQLRI